MADQDFCKEEKNNMLKVKAELSSYPQTSDKILTAIYSTDAPPPLKRHHELLMHSLDARTL